MVIILGCDPGETGSIPVSHPKGEEMHMVQCVCGAKHYSRDDEYDHWQVCPKNPYNIIERIQKDLTELKSLIRKNVKVY